MDLDSGRLTSDPLGGPITSGGEAIKRRGEFQLDEGPFRAQADQKHLCYVGAGGQLDAFSHDDAGSPKSSGAARGERVRIGVPDHDASDPGVDQGLRAGWCTTVMIAGL